MDFRESRDTMVTRSDDTWTRDNGRFLSTSRERERALRSRRVKSRQVAIQEDQAGVLGLQRLHLKYYSERALKRLLNLKPTTAILGSSHPIIHVILPLTDGKSMTNYRLLE